MRRRILAAVLIACVGTAHADAPPDAIALFEQGIKDMQAGNVELACRELAASLAMYRDSGTKGALAECYTRLGKVASAWKLWKDLADTAPAELRPEAAANAAQLEARLPRYLLKLSPQAPATISVTVNGARVIDPTLPVPLPIDPGAVLVTAAAPEFKTWSQSFQAREGATITIEVPPLVAAPTPPPPQPPPAVAVPSAPVRDDDSSGARRTRRIIGGVTMLAGVSAIGVGAYFGFGARSDWSQAQELCGGDIDSCPSSSIGPAQLEVDEARTAARTATVMFAVGGALVLGGAVVWLTAPSAERRVAVTPALGPRSTGLALSGSF